MSYTTEGLKNTWILKGQGVESEYSRFVFRKGEITMMCPLKARSIVCKRDFNEVETGRVGRHDSRMHLMKNRSHLFVLFVIKFFQKKNPQNMGVVAPCTKTSWLKICSGAVAFVVKPE